MAPEKLEDFEIFVLQQVVSGISMQSRNIDASDYESIIKLLKEILTSAGFINMPSFEKVKLVYIILLILRQHIVIRP